MPYWEHDGQEGDKYEYKFEEKEEEHIMVGSSLCCCSMCSACCGDGRVVSGRQSHQRYVESTNMAEYLTHYNVPACRRLSSCDTSCVHTPELLLPRFQSKQRLLSPASRTRVSQSCSFPGGSDRLPQCIRVAVAVDTVHAFSLK